MAFFSGDSFGYVPESDAYVNVMQPVSVNVNPLADILEIALGKEPVEETDDKTDSAFYALKWKILIF